MKQKRKLFDELMEGVDAMQQQREGKITLRSHEVEDLPPLEVDAALIRDTRERMHVSRAVFARRLRVSTRTLENWEQGRARPNAQAAALILMVRKFPDTLENSANWATARHERKEPTKGPLLATTAGQNGYLRLTIPNRCIWGYFWGICNVSHLPGGRG